MMTNVFSVFDPTSSIFNLSMNWVSTLLGMLILPMMFWLIPTRSSLIWNKIILTLRKELKTFLGESSLNGSTFIFISVFTMILFNNFMGLFPYISNSSSHLAITLTLGLPLWLSFMIYGWISHMFAHLVPLGTPPVLKPFMVCIETISDVIRPGTLAVLLAANMIAGHLLINLLGNTGPTLIYSILYLLSPANLLYICWFTYGSSMYVCVGCLCMSMI